MSASGPVQEPKMFPAATMEDQETAMAGNPDNVIVLGGAPFSSPDPETIAKKMLPIEDGTSAYEAREVASDQRETTDYNELSVEELDNLVAERDLAVTGTGANGKVLKKDKVAALQADDTSDLKAADFKQRIADATTQEELDAAAEFYQNSGKEYSSVEAAVEKRQEELNEAANGDGNDS